MSHYRRCELCHENRRLSATFVGDYSILFDAYVDKSESGEQSIQLTEKEIAQFEFSNASTNL